MKTIKQNPEITIIFLIGILIRLYFAHLDPYLHDWDERFHALVSRNLMDNPLVPLLHKNPIVPYDLNSWCSNSVWLHKQPLFMWQMAISMKLFGVSVFIMRLPSALMGAITILLLYRITILLTNNKTTSIVAALLICFSQYQLEMISGQIGMDHNDMAFCFYILASFWAFSEKIKNEKLIWNVLIGIFAGCAILNKWLVGLLVFLPYGIFAIQQFYHERKSIQIKKLIVSLFFCVAICLPWQLYLLHNFYEMAVFEYNVNADHIFNTVHGQSGSKLFYLKKFSDYFGKYIWNLIILGTSIVLIKKEKFNTILNWSIFISFCTVFVFFSLIVKSKLPTYFFIAVPFGIIYISIGIQQILQLINKKWIHYFLIFVAVTLAFNPNKSIALRKNNPERANKIYNTNIYKNLHKIIPPYVKTVINMNSYEDIDVMFYNNDFLAYHWWIDVKHLDSLKNKKIWIGAFKNHGNYNLPIEYSYYPYLYIIDTVLK